MCSVGPPGITMEPLQLLCASTARIGSCPRTKKLLLLEMFSASNTFLKSISHNSKAWSMSHVCLAQTYCNWLALLIKTSAWQGNPVKESLSVEFQLNGRILYVFPHMENRVTESKTKLCWGFCLFSLTESSLCLHELEGDWKGPSWSSKAQHLPISAALFVSPLNFGEKKKKNREREGSDRLNLHDCALRQMPSGQ